MRWPIVLESREVESSTHGQARTRSFFSPFDVLFFLSLPPKELISASHLLFCSIFFVSHVLCFKPTLALSPRSLRNNYAICFPGNVLKQFK